MKREEPKPTSSAAPCQLHSNVEDESMSEQPEAPAAGHAAPIAGAIPYQLECQPSHGSSSPLSTIHLETITAGT